MAERAARKKATSPISDVDKDKSFVETEREILAFWKKAGIFEKSLEKTKNGKPFSFYDGPPFATGLPHYGHLLAGTLKDIIPRFWTMKGCYVDRRFGWDCHGLPVEYEIDQKLGLQGRTAVEKFGIANYNRECRNIVLRYTAEWERTVERMGRWVSFKNSYRTMDRDFMESVWWAFQQLWKKGLIYKGYKVVPFSTAVSTVLSNFESNLNYKEVVDPAITIALRLDDEPDTDVLAWTTTPWTLPSNLALAVGNDIDYVKVKDGASPRHFIMAACRISQYYHSEGEYEVVGQFKGSALVGRRYQPLFNYFSDKKQNGAFRIIAGNFVTTETGTGIVHIAPGFGEDDYFACKAEGIDVVCPVDDEGKFTAEVSDYKGVYVKDADKPIIKRLKDEGRLIHQGTVKHSYPFCWRTDTPLIYKAVDTWFVNVEKIRAELIANNKQINWVPSYVGTNRFGNWLEGAIDWAISRSRFWGTPIPIWVSEDGSSVVCVGSVRELEERTGKKVTDLHREHVDALTFTHPDYPGKMFRRIPDVLDCWFESGSMPWAQIHYPLESQDAFEKSFPADFIAEGLDQTRGWFYSLLVLSTALFGRSSYRNVIVNGLVLAEDGKKMSKRLQNYPMPDKVIETYGADALRLYMINSPVVRAEELRFSEEGVKDIVRRVLLPWWNSYSFFVTYARIDGWVPEKKRPELTNILDRWILSRTHSLIQAVDREMQGYRLYTVVPILLEFVDELTNWYIRLNRRRFWASDSGEDKQAAYEALYEVLITLCRLMAPFTPFVCDAMYSNLKNLLSHSEESIHLEAFPIADSRFVDNALERAVSRMQQVILLGRRKRNDVAIKVKVPLKSLKIIHRDGRLLEDIRKMEGYIKEELNVRQVLYDTDEARYIELYAKPNPRAIGKRFGARYKEFDQAIQSLDPEVVVSVEEGKTVTVLGESISPEELTIYRGACEGTGALTNRLISILLDTTIEEEQIIEGLSRELVNRVQNLRKEADFRVEDHIGMTYQASGKLRAAVLAHADYIRAECLADELVERKPEGERVQSFDINGEPIVIGVRRILKA